MGTHFKGTKEEVNALNVYVKLIRAAESLSSRINANVTKEGITESQFAILEALYHLGPMCQKDLGSKLLKSGGNITMVVDNLEKQGYVKRERGKDRRFFTIILTDEGKKIIEKIFPVHLSAIVKEISILSEDEQLELQRLCKLIGLNKNGLQKQTEEKIL